MSYCRWSSDDFQSDLYIYDSHEGVTIHVADSRFVLDRSKLPPVAEMGDPGWAESWAQRSVAIHELIDQSEIEPITLPQAGETFVFEDGFAAADKVDELIALGYYVPAGVTESLRDDASG